MFEKDDNSDVTRFEQLKADIKELQSKGVLVKLSYGGEEWGNTDLLGTYQGRVIHQSDFLNKLLHFYLISIKKFLKILGQTQCHLCSSANCKNSGRIGS